MNINLETPPMSYYTILEAWLILSQPIGFFALLFLKRSLLLEQRYSSLSERLYWSDEKQFWNND